MGLTPSSSSSSSQNADRADVPTMALAKVYTHFWTLRFNFES